MARMSGTGLFATLALALNAHAADLGPFTQASDIGAVSKPISSTYDRSSGIYFIGAGGENLWGERDAFGFVWKEMKGDAQLGARVYFMGKSDQAHRKAGVMFRESLAPESIYADVVVHGDGLTSLQYRAETGGPTREIQCATEAPTAVRLEKRGDYLQVSLAQEDGAFSPSGCAIRLPLRGKFLGGLVVCAHDAQGFETARFSSVTVGLPPKRNPMRVWAIESVPVDSLSRKILWYSRSKLEVPTFTAEGNAICFRDDGQLKRLSLVGRAEPAVVGAENIESCQAAIPPIKAGVRLTHRVDGGRAQIWRESAGQKPERLTKDSLNHWQPRISPDASAYISLAGAARPEDGRPALGDYLLLSTPLEGGESRVLAEFHGGPGSLGITPWSADGKRVVFVSREPELEE